MRIKKFSIYILFITAATILQSYWAFGDLRDHMSSACMTCSFFEDAFYLAIMLVIFVMILFLALQKLNVKRPIYFWIMIPVCIFFWWMTDYSIFNDREASWSTYTNLEIHYIIGIRSGLAIAIFSVLHYFMLKFLFKQK